MDCIEVQALVNALKHYKTELHHNIAIALDNGDYLVVSELYQKMYTNDKLLLQYEQLLIDLQAK